MLNNFIKEHDEIKEIHAISIDNDNKKILFNQKSSFKYEIINNKLIYKTPLYDLNVINMDIDYLIKSDDTDAFFVSNGSLYHINIYKGITKLIENKEWLYNKGNIFVF